MQDVVILNKIDLISHEDSESGTSDAVEELEKEIHDINSLATIIRSVRCQVDLCKILDRQAYGAQVSKTYCIYPSCILLQIELKLIFVILFITVRILLI